MSRFGNFLKRLSRKPVVVLLARGAEAAAEQAAVNAVERAMKGTFDNLVHRGDAQAVAAKAADALELIRATQFVGRDASAKGLMAKLHGTLSEAAGLPVVQSAADAAAERSRNKNGSTGGAGDPRSDGTDSKEP